MTSEYVMYLLCQIESEKNFGDSAIYSNMLAFHVEPDRCSEYILLLFMYVLIYLYVLCKGRDVGA